MDTRLNWSHAISDKLPIIVIYEDPLDYPDLFVARRHWVDETGPSPELEPLAVGFTLEDVRAAVPVGMIRIPRDPRDEEQIVESWL